MRRKSAIRKRERFNFSLRLIFLRVRSPAPLQQRRFRRSGAARRIQQAFNLMNQRSYAARVLLLRSAYHSGQSIGSTLEDVEISFGEMKDPFFHA